MFFSWLFLLFLASYGFSGAQSHAAHEFLSENEAAESYGTRSLAVRDADYGYYRAAEKDYGNEKGLQMTNRAFERNEETMRSMGSWPAGGAENKIEEKIYKARALLKQLNEREDNA